MNVIRATIPDVLIIEPKVFGDQRGFFSRATTGAPTLAAKDAAATRLIDAEVFA